MKREHRISNAAAEVITAGGFHVGYVWEIADGWTGRGRGKCRTTQLSARYPTADIAAAELKKLLIAEGMFD
jgi:hypothetical protein